MQTANCKVIETPVYKTTKLKAAKTQNRKPANLPNRTAAKLQLQSCKTAATAAKQTSAKPQTCK